MIAVLFLAAQVAFYVVFGVFVIAFVVLAVITLRWAVRRDRVGRAAWRNRRASANPGDVDPHTDGQTPPGSGPARDVRPPKS